MKKSQEKIIESTIKFVKSELENAEGGHDWFHVERVFKNAVLLSREESVDIFVVSLAALLHDIADSKFHNGDERIGPKKARVFLESQQIDSNIVDHVVEIIKHVSFKNSLDRKKENFSSLELELVQDADRLDAIGAIGIARCFHYGGFKNHQIYNPEILPNLKLSKEAYKNSDAPSINHFYEKLLLLKTQMNTNAGKKIAAQRHLFMENFLAKFYDEWNGKS